MSTTEVLQYWTVTVHHNFAWLCFFFSSPYPIMTRLFSMSKAEIFKRVILQGTIPDCLCYSFVASGVFFPMNSHSLWSRVNPALGSREADVLNQGGLLAVKVMSDFGDHMLGFHQRKLW